MGNTMGMSHEDSTREAGRGSKTLDDFLDATGINILMTVIKEFSQNINNYIPLSKMFYIIIYIFIYEFSFQKDPETMINIYIIYIVKFLICAIIIIMPIILLVTTLIQFDNIIKKNKKYWWAEEKYIYLNTKYIYIKKIYDIFGITLSHNIIVYLSCSILFIIMTSIIFIKFPELLKTQIKDDDTNTDNNPLLFKRLIYYNGSIFFIIFFIITIFIGINYNKYNRVFGYNKEINNIYLRYLNKDYIKKICNNFIDDDNNISDICTFKKVPDTYDLDDYLKNLRIDKISSLNIDLDNEKFNINNDTLIANKFLSALITHQFLLFIYNNQYKDKSKDNKFCRELKLNTILNNKIDNIFYCYNETQQFPFIHNVEELLGNDNSYFLSNNNYIIKTMIIDKYLEINNKLAKNITNIKKENIDEIKIVILISSIFIIYLIGLFFVFENKPNDKKT